MYVKHLNNNKCQSFESVSASKIFITHKTIECRHGYFQENTAVVIIKAEYDYDTKTYLVTLRDLYHNQDKFRVDSSEDKFKELFRVDKVVSDKYNEYREQVEQYYADNVKAFDNITLWAICTTVISLLGGMILTAVFLGGPMDFATWVTDSNIVALVVILELFMFIVAIALWVYKSYIKYIKKKDNWGGMLATEQESRAKLAEEVEEIIKGQL